MRLKILCSLILTVLCAGCTGSGPSLSSARNPAVHFQVAAPYSLEIAGQTTGTVPALDQILSRPVGRMNFQLYAKPGQTELDSFAIISRTNIGMTSWRFDLERNTFHVISQETFRNYGQFWTQQLLMIEARTDWFTALWQANGRTTTAERWIAFRYSATPSPQIRMLVEYREKATPCMMENWQNHPTSARRNLVNMCTDDVRAFQGRAMAAISIEEGFLTEEPTPQMATFTNPRTIVNMGEIVGFSTPRLQGADRLVFP